MYRIEDTHTPESTRFQKRHVCFRIRRIDGEREQLARRAVVDCLPEDSRCGRGDDGKERRMVVAIHFDVVSHATDLDFVDIVRRMCESATHPSCICEDNIDLPRLLVPTLQAVMSGQSLEIERTNDGKDVSTDLLMVLGRVTY